MFNLQGCSKEDFKAVSTLVASISPDNHLLTKPYVEGFNPIQYGGGALWPPIVFPKYLWNDLS